MAFAPVEQAIDSYAVRYLQVFDQVTARAESVRMQIADLLKRHGVIVDTDSIYRWGEGKQTPSPEHARVLDEVYRSAKTRKG